MWWREREAEKRNSLCAMKRGGVWSERPALTPEAVVVSRPVLPPRDLS